MDIQVIHPGDRQVGGDDATSGMLRERAIADDGIWLGLVRAAPNRPSGWHHHGDYDTYFYVLDGTITMEFGPGGEQSIEAGPGDFVHVPSHVVHREVNSADREGAIVLARVGSGPPVVNVDGPAPL